MQKSSELSPLILARRIFTRFVKKEDEVVAVAVGGSVARGETVSGSDIDILYFCRAISEYRKEFHTVQSWPVEIHRIPCVLMSVLVRRLAPILVNPPRPLWEHISSPSILGEKYCPFDTMDRTDIHRQMSAWRELRKMLDSVPLRDDAGWLQEEKVNYRCLGFDRKKLTSALRELRSLDYPLHASFLALQIDAAARGESLSKPMWIDCYLQNSADSVLDAKVRAVANSFCRFDPAWVSYAEACVEAAGHGLRTHFAMCRVCEGEPLRCHLARTASDYLADTTRAIENGWEIGAEASLQRSVTVASARLAAAGCATPALPGSWSEAWRPSSERMRELQGVLKRVEQRLQKEQAEMMS